MLNVPSSPWLFAMDVKRSVPAIVLAKSVASALVEVARLSTERVRLCTDALLDAVTVAISASELVASLELKMSKLDAMLAYQAIEELKTILR